MDTIEDVGLDIDENLMRMSVKMIAERGKYHIEGSIKTYGGYHS